MRNEATGLAYAGSRAAADAVAPAEGVCAAETIGANASCFTYVPGTDLVAAQWVPRRRWQRRVRGELRRPKVLIITGSRTPRRASAS